MYIRLASDHNLVWTILVVVDPHVHRVGQGTTHYLALKSVLL